MIREMRLSDLDGVYGLINELAGKTLERAAFAPVFEECVRSLHWFGFVYELDSALLGCVTVRLERQLHHAGKVAEVMELIVRQDERSRGLGKELFAHAEQFVREQGCPYLELCSSRSRIQAHAFYEREGMIRSHYKFTKTLG